MSRPRRQAREAALQILYFAEIGKTGAGAALDTFFSEHQPDASDAVRTFAAELVNGTSSELAVLDEIIGRHSEHWRVERLAVIDRLILRLAIWELRHERETPPAVVLNEAIELARRYGTDESARFVNGVLDSVRKALDA